MVEVLRRPIESAPFLIIGVVAWVVLASLAAVKASQGQPYRYPLTLRLVR
jgi:uncharacterized protein